MPPQALPPQTSKKARRAYLKSHQHFQFTATQLRAAERRDELEARAKKLEAKEERKKTNKRKRDDKEASDREAKRRQVAEGKLPPEAVLGKIAASQPRLNAFFSKPKATKLESLHESESDTDSEDSVFEEVERHIPDQRARALSVQTEDLEDFFSSATSQCSTTMAQSLAKDNVQDATTLRADKVIVVPPKLQEVEPTLSQSAEQALLDAQLSSFGADLDFDILEDQDADPVMLPAKITLLATPSKRKAAEADFVFVSPAKSARSALSEMSPSKVNVRAQEKPDIFSVAPSSANLPSPSPKKQTATQSAQDIIAMIGTQDLEDDEFSIDKENEDPWQPASMRKSQQTAVANAKGSSGHIVDYRSRNASRDLRASYDDDNIFDDDLDFESGLDDDLDDFDDDLDDETVAALAAQSPSALKLSSFTAKSATIRAESGSVKSAPKQSSTVQEPSIAPNFADIQAKIMPPPPARHTLSSDILRPQSQPPASTKGNSFSFDVEDDDLNCLADEFDTENATVGSQQRKGKNKTRTIPWNHPSQFPPSQPPTDPLSQDEDPYD